MKVKNSRGGGTRKAYEEYLETIKNHIAVTWEGGRDLKKIMIKSDVIQELPFTNYGELSMIISI